jgi:hypothetical protein
MNAYRHHVSGFFSIRKDADRVLARLVETGMPRERIHIFERGTPPEAKPPESSNEVLKDVLVDGAIGTAIGTGLGALAQLALVAGNISLFVASPLVAPLVMLGWGASLGGLLGALTGAEEKHGPFSELVTDAIASGQSVLVAETLTEKETASARKVIEAMIGGYQDKNAA